jgi:hypothetical protein
MAQVQMGQEFGAQAANSSEGIPPPWVAWFRQNAANPMARSRTEVSTTSAKNGG